MKARLAQYPAFMAVIGLIAGIVLWRLGCPAWVSAVIVIAGALMLAFFRNPIAVALMTVGVGWSVAYFNEPVQMPEGLENRRCRFSGIVSDYSQSATSATAIVAVDSVIVGQTVAEPAPFNVRLTTNLGVRPFSPGDRIWFHGVVQSVDASADYPGQPDLTDYYLQNSIVAEAFVQDDSITVVGHERTLTRVFYDMRDRVVSVIAHSGVNDVTFGLLAALIVGYDDELDYGMKEDFRTVGIAHALALSGFHVGVIAFIIYVLLFPLRTYRLRLFRMLLTILLLFLYALLVGMSVSVVRAVIMASCCLLARIIGTFDSPFNSLCSAVFLILIFSPFSLYSVGLQLSVSAVLGLIMFAQVFNPVSPKRHMLYVVVSIFAATTAAVIGTMPVTMWHFHRLPLLFIVSNVVVAVAIPLLMAGGIILIVASALGIPHGALVWILDGVTGMLESFAGGLAELPFAEVSQIYLSAPAFVVLVAFILIGAYVMNNPSRRTLAVLVGVAVAVLPVFMLTRTTVPVEPRCILLREPSPATLVVVDDNVAHAVPLAHPRNVSLALPDALDRFMEFYGLDSAVIHMGDFVVDKRLSRTANVLTVDTMTIAVPSNLLHHNVVDTVDILLLRPSQMRYLSRYRRQYNPDSVHLTTTPFSIGL